MMIKKIERLSKGIPTYRQIPRYINRCIKHQQVERARDRGKREREREREGVREKKRKQPYWI